MSNIRNKIRRTTLLIVKKKVSPKFKYLLEIFGSKASRFVIQEPVTVIRGKGVSDVELVKGVKLTTLTNVPNGYLPKHLVGENIMEAGARPGCTSGIGTNSYFHEHANEYFGQSLKNGKVIDYDAFDNHKRYRGAYSLIEITTGLDVEEFTPEESDE